MACKTETKVIGELEYSVTQWPASKSILMKARLLKMFGAALAAAGADVKKIDIEAAITSLFNGSSPDDVMNLIMDTVVGVGVNETIITKSTFDELFSGDELVNVYSLFFFIIKVNYKNLLKGEKAKSFLERLDKTASD